MKQAAKLSIQFARLRQLRDGWLHEDTPALDGNLLDRFELLLTKLEKRKLPRPSIYGTHEGGAIAEWTSGPHEASIEARVDSDMYLAQALNCKTNEWSESDVADEDQANAFLAPFLEDGDTYGE